MSKSKTPKRAVIYCRISLDQTGEGLGIARQEQACRELAERRGWHVLDVIADNSVSATKGTRPGWSKVLGLIETRAVDVVVAWAVDRMYRQPRDLEDLVDLAEGTGVIFASVSGDIDLSSADGRMVARIMGGINRAEVERKGARQKLAHQQRRERGKPFWGTRPYGYERDGTIVPDEAKLLREAYRRLLDGAALAHIAKDWNAEGYRTTKGLDWNSTGLRQTVMHPRNAGYITERGEVVGKGSWKPIVDEDTYRAVVRVLDAPERKNKGGGQRKGLLVGIARCGKCRQATVRQAQSRKRRDGSQYRVYVCSGGQCVTYPADVVDGIVVESLLSIPPATLYRLMGTGGAGPNAVDADALHERQSVLRSGRQQAADDHYAGLIDRQTFTTSLARIDAELADIDRQLTDAMRGDALADVDLSRLAETWEDLTFERKRALIQRVYSAIWLTPRGKGRGRHVYKSDVAMFARPLLDQADTDAMMERAEGDGRMTDAELDEWVASLDGGGDE